MWFKKLVLISAITMISQLDGYHMDKDMPLGRHRRKGAYSAREGYKCTQVDALITEEAGGDGERYVERKRKEGLCQRFIKSHRET